MAKILFSKADAERIKEAISAADKRTGCEIVTVVAQNSGRYDRAEDVFGILLAIIILILTWIGLPLIQTPQIAGGTWTEATNAVLGLPLIIAIIIGGFILGAVLATRFPMLKTLFIARQEMAEEVAKAAQSFFYESGLRYAHQGAGILLYVSTYERMVHIIGDDATSNYLHEKDWDDIRDILIAGLKQNKSGDGLVNAIACIADRLDGVFLTR